MRRLLGLVLAAALLAALALQLRLPARTGLAAPATVTFDERPGQEQPLNGQYPAGLIDWGAGGWYHSGPWGAFSTRSVSFANASLAQGTFRFLTARRLVSLKAYNGGPGSATVTLSCGGQTAVVATVPAGQVITLATGWTGPCAIVTVGSSNGWDTNFDDLVHAGG
jgi:hypothetical protein